MMALVLQTTGRIPHDGELGAVVNLRPGIPRNSADFRPYRHRHMARTLVLSRRACAIGARLEENGNTGDAICTAQSDSPRAPPG